MAKMPYFPFFPGDWLRDEVAGCSLAAQGLWLRMMILAHDSDRYGYLAKDGVATPPGSIARRCGCTLDQYTTLLAELDEAGVPSRTAEGIIYSRRMVRDGEIRQKRAQSGSKGGRAKARKQRNKVHSSKSLAKDVANSYQNPEYESEIVSESGIVLPREGVQGKGAVTPEAIYEAYPRKVARGYALKAIEKAIAVIGARPNPPADPAGWLLARVQEFASSPAGKAGQYTPHPATWFNGARYDDPPKEWQRGDGNGTAVEPNFEYFKKMDEIMGRQPR